MAHLNAPDRSELLKLLNTLPLLQTYRSRRVLLESAGLDPVISQVDLEGPPFVVNGDLIHVLEAYGRITYER